MADLSWSKDAARRLSPGVGLLIAAAVSLLLWLLVLCVGRLF
jgi:hypothetical protein